MNPEDIHAPDPEPDAASACSGADADAAAAQRLIEQFIAQARGRGIRPEPLRARLSSGGTARTDKKGWYIKTNQSAGIGEDGGYYVLSIPGGLRERLSGVRLKPSRPRLRVGPISQDDETGGLADFLIRRLRAAHPEQ